MNSNDPWDLKEFKRELHIIFDNFKAELFDAFKNDKSESTAKYTEETSYNSYDSGSDNDDKPCDETVDSDDDTSEENSSERSSAYSSEEEEFLTDHILDVKRPETKKYFKTKVLLDFYPPSEEMKLAHASQFSKEVFENNSNKDFLNYLELPILAAHNSHHIFKVLLQMEDLTTMTTYVPLALNDIILNTTPSRGQYWIAIENMPTIDQVLTPYMDEVVIVPKASAISTTQPVIGTDLLLPHADETTLEVERRRHIATVEQVSKDRVYFKFPPKQNMNLPVFITKYDIIFRPRRLPMRYQYRALELFAEDSKMRNFLFPTLIVRCEQLPNTDTRIKLINHDISSNPEQLQAVLHISRRSRLCAPYVIFGPPGTGKTTTIVESILQLRLHQTGSRILVTAGSNSACDTIALRICKYFDSSQQLQPISDCLPLIRIYSKSVEKKGLQLLEEELIKYSNCKGGEHYYPAVEEIRKYGIVVTTLSTVGKLVTGDIGANDFFTHIFIDEAGASTEPETLVGIMGTKSLHCNVILSGDHKQLGPVLKCERAAELGLKMSMMERLLNSRFYAVDGNGNYDSSLQSRLCRNYRSHPAIVGIYNKLYYNGELVAHAGHGTTHLVSKWRILPNSEFPIIFQAVHGNFAKEEGSSSSYNQLEIQVLFWYLQRLLIDGIDGKPVDQADIGIITPYKLQCKRIQNQLSLRCWHNVDVGSVETYQGREKPIIIVSLVRSFSGLGFVKNPQRLNVLLSRAKSILLLIGNPVTLGHNKDFKYIIEECKKNKTYLRKKRHLPPLLKIRKQNLLNFGTELQKEQQSTKITDTGEVGAPSQSSVDVQDKADITQCETKILQNYELNYQNFLNSIPLALRRSSSNEYNPANTTIASSRKYYSKEILKKIGMQHNPNSSFAHNNNDKNENCRVIRTPNSTGFFKENQENNPNFFNSFKSNDSPNLDILKSQHDNLTKRNYLECNSDDTIRSESKTKILTQIVRPCWKCATNYWPGIPMLSGRLVKYSRDDLKKFLYKSSDSDSCQT